MLTKQQVQDVLNETSMIQDIGQIDHDTHLALNRAVKKGILAKSREPWAGIAVMKTTYRLA